MASLALESFEGERLEAPPEPTFEDGYIAGYEAGRAEAEETQGRLSAELTASVRAIAEAHGEAEARILAALQPLFVALTDQLLPALAREVIGPTVVEELGARAAGTTEQALWLRTSPGDHPAVTAALEAAGMQTTVVPDGALGPGQALIGSSDGGDFLDLEEVVAAIRSALAALTTPYSGETD